MHRKFALLSLVLLVAAIAPAAASAKGEPHITAFPSKVAEGKTVRLFGSNFARDSEITISECSQTGWFAIEGTPCLTSNQVSLKTSFFGTFDTSMEIGLCEEAVFASVRTKQRTCYVGEASQASPELYELLGAAPIRVSYK